MAVRRGRGEPTSIGRGDGGAGCGVKTVLGEACGASGTYDGSGLIVTAFGNASESVFERPSHVTCAPRQRASGVSSTSTGSPSVRLRALQVVSSRRAVTLPPRTSTLLANRATSSTGTITWPPTSIAGGALGRNTPSTSTATRAAT